jgi:ABC-type polysaccharide/polyol phosphate export permease
MTDTGLSPAENGPTARALPAQEEARGLANRTGDRGRRHGFAHTLDVVYVLISRQIKGKYKNTVVGFAWSWITPLLYLLVFYWVFKIGFNIRIPSYATFALTGILTWMWVQTALSESTTSITAHGSLVNQPGFPVAALPVVAIATSLINFVAGLPVLLAIALIEGASINWTLLLLPAVMAVQFLLMLGFAYLFAAVTVSLRDMQYALPVLLQLGYYVTPIFYNADAVPAEYHLFLVLNPMYHIISAYRSIILDGSIPELTPLIWITAGSILFLVITRRYFTKASVHFLEEL